MRTAAFTMATIFAIAALPLILRITFALRVGLRRKALIASARLSLAAAAAAVLVTIAGRLR